MNYYIHVLQNYATFEGRARRMEFWVFALISAVVAAILRFIENITGLFPNTPYYVLENIYMLAVLIPSLAVWVRRLHDTDKSGIWLLLIFVPVVGWLVLIILAFAAGDSGSNQYGPDPKA